MITMDKERLIYGEPTAELVKEAMERFEPVRERLNGLRAYYDGEHPICGRGRQRGAPNFRLRHDFPSYIVAMTSGYLVGEPIQYTAPEGEDMTALRESLRLSAAPSVDSELAADAAIYGLGVELYYSDENAMPRFSEVDARNAFVVYDSSVEHRPLFGVLISDSGDRRGGQRLSVYTDSLIIRMERAGTELPHEVSREAHFFGQVPVTEYWNNSRERGDFEGVTELIDAYDALQSDRVNDKQQFTDALMVIYGASVECEEGDERNFQQRLRESRTLEMPAADARVEYLTKKLSESDNEILKDSIKADIHKLSFVPDLTDREFASNTSGVAMEYKLFGLEQLTKSKERWFREGLQSRLRCLCRFLYLSGKPVPNPDSISISFSRSLPVNRLEIAQTVKAYEGLVPKKLLLSQIPFIEDADEALRMIDAGHGD